MRPFVCFAVGFAFILCGYLNIINMAYDVYVFVAGIIDNAVKRLVCIVVGYVVVVVNLAVDCTDYV